MERIFPTSIGRVERRFDIFNKILYVGSTHSFIPSCRYSLYTMSLVLEIVSEPGIPVTQLVKDVWFPEYAGRSTSYESTNIFFDDFF